MTKWRIARAEIRENSPCRCTDFDLPPGAGNRLRCTTWPSIHYRPRFTPEEAAWRQLQAIAIVTAGLDSPELLQRELRDALGSKPDAKSWTLLMIALGQVGMKMTALAATMDAENVEVVSGAREQITPFTLLQNWAQLIIADADPLESLIPPTS